MARGASVGCSSRLLGCSDHRADAGRSVINRAGKEAGRFLAVRAAYSWMFVLVVIGGHPGPAFAQHACNFISADSRSGVNNLWVDFQVIGAPEDATLFYEFLLIHDLDSSIHERQATGERGRFRFSSVSNGGYILVVRNAGKDIFREKFTVTVGKSTDIIKSLELSWSGVDEALTSGIVYARSSRNQKRMDSALEAIEQGDRKKGARLLEKIVKDDANDYEAWTELGTGGFQRDEFREAEKAYKTATEVRSLYLLAWLNLGKVRMARGDFEGALEALEEAAAIDEGRGETAMLLGEWALQLKQGSRAVAFFTRALELDPIGMAEAERKKLELNAPIGRRLPRVPALRLGLRAGRGYSKARGVQLWRSPDQREGTLLEGRCAT